MDSEVNSIKITVNKKYVLLGYAIQEILLENELIDARPKDLMELLIKKGFFKNDHRDGLPLRNILRELDKRNELYLIPQVRVERKDKNRFWYFNPVQL
ncbi:MAG: hypothetical protein ACI9Z3_001003 [Roseivirga sp.]|jgi:hypothetical protein